MNKFFFGIAILMGLIGCSETENKLEVFVSGAEIAGVNGIIFGPDGYLYATSVIGSDISVVDRTAPAVTFIETLIKKDLIQSDEISELSLKDLENETDIVLPENFPNEFVTVPLISPSRGNIGYWVMVRSDRATNTEKELLLHISELKIQRKDFKLEIELLNIYHDDYKDMEIDLVEDIDNIFLKEKIKGELKELLDKKLEIENKIKECEEKLNH